MGASAILRDITARRQAQESLRQSEADLREAQRVGNVGSWRWDSKKDTVTWSEELYRIFGCDSHLPAPSFPQICSLISPAAVLQLTRLRSRALDTGETYDFDMEIVQPTGTVRWVAVRGLADYDALSQVTGLHGTVQDITERKQRTEELRRLNEDLESLVAERTSELQAILDAAPIPIWIAHDPECLHVTGNLYAGQMARQASSAEGPVPYTLLQSGREIQRYRLPAEMAIASGKPVVNQELDLCFADGRNVNLLLFAAPLFDRRGNVRGTVTAGTDITELRTAERLRDSILNSLNASVAVISSDGVILTTNDSWNRFASQNGSPSLAAVGPGANYLNACRRLASMGVADVQQAVDGILSRWPYQFLPARIPMSFLN